MAGMKKEKAEQQLQNLCQEAKDTIARWKSHKENGCSDPFYPDGVNMNCLRNHLIYYKRQIKEICTKHGMTLPPEAFLPGLPYTDSNYFAKPKSDRAKRIMDRPRWRCCNHEEPRSEYDESLLTFL